MLTGVDCGFQETGLCEERRFRIYANWNPLVVCRRYVCFYCMGKHPLEVLVALFSIYLVVILVVSSSASLV